MPLALLLLQIANVVLAGATLWIRFRAPLLWDDQAIVFSTCAGTLAASVTALLLGLSLLAEEETPWGAVLANLALTMAFAGLQGYYLLFTGRDLGVLRILKSRLGGG
jgi:drug/metabolite transporter (DMT)-like permease